MIILHADLDNTLIYSCKRDTGERKRCVEVYRGREASFMTERTHELLLSLMKCKDVSIVPTTTRTEEQYERIDWGIQAGRRLKYALVCNGGVLLADGIEDEAWYRRSLRLASSCMDTMLEALDLLKKDRRRIFEERFIRELFVFTKCDEPEAVVSDLKENLDVSQADVFNNGNKIYVVPKALSKGSAVRRFKEYMQSGASKAARRDTAYVGTEQADITAAIGDSELDISMFREADVAAAPAMLAEKSELPAGTAVMPGERLFAEEALAYILALCEGKYK